MGGWISLETGTLMKNQTTTCNNILYCTFPATDLTLVGQAVFFSFLPATSLSCPVNVHSSSCLFLQTHTRTSLFYQNEELLQFCRLVPMFEPFDTYGQL